MWFDLQANSLSLVDPEPRLKKILTVHHCQNTSVSTNKIEMPITVSPLSVNNALKARQNEEEVYFLNIALRWDVRVTRIALT